MEALSVDEIPTGVGWQYEPKWDGFRCLAFRDGAKVKLQSKSGQSLERYFPEVAATLQNVAAKRFVIDGELVVPVEGRLSFDDLLQRIHPAESRVRRLAAETPASFVVFDLLVDSLGQLLTEELLKVRRQRLLKMAPKLRKAGLFISPATTDRRVAMRWFRAAGRGALDGVIAKRLDLGYESGERTMLKIKPNRTADCVVGGFRYASTGRIVGSLLLGLYDADGLLHHVGFTSAMSLVDRRKLTPRLEGLVSPPGFTGKAPGGPSRWSTKRSTEWKPLAPGLVIEVEYDHVSGGRFRHGTRFLRWRPDKSPSQCTFDQLQSSGKNMWKLLQTP